MFQNFECFRIELVKRVDKEKKVFYLGQVKCPMRLDFKRGVLFRAFTSIEDGEELNIEVPNDISYINEYKIVEDNRTKEDRLHVSLSTIESNGDYLAVVKSDYLEPIDLYDGYLFFLFNSKKGVEQLQIVKYVSNYTR